MVAEETKRPPRRSPALRKTATKSTDKARDETDQAARARELQAELESSKAELQQMLDLHGKDRRTIGEELNHVVLEELSGLELLSASLIEQFPPESEQRQRAVRLTTALSALNYRVAQLAESLVPLGVEGGDLKARRSATEKPRPLSAARAIRILIVDDHPLMRYGLAARIGKESDMQICGEADSTGAALICLARVEPDVVIVDVTMKGGHGLELIKQIRARDTTAKILVLSAHSEALYGGRVLRLGALGFLHKQQAQANLVVAIRCVAAGKRYVSEQLAQRLVEDAIGGRRRESSSVERLTDRELQVFECIGSGKATRRIAEELGLSIHTIETYRENIRSKLHLKNGFELVQYAVQWRIENR